MAERRPAGTPDLKASMEELFRRRQEERPAEALAHFGLPPGHAPPPAFYQDYLPPSTDTTLPFPVERVDQPALMKAAAEGNEAAQKALLELSSQSKQRPLNANERSFMEEAFAHAIQKSREAEDQSSSGGDA